MDGTIMWCLDRRTARGQSAGQFVRLNTTLKSCINEEDDTRILKDAVIIVLQHKIRWASYRSTMLQEPHEILSECL